MSFARTLYYTQDTFTVWRKSRASNGRDYEYALVGSFPCTWTDKPNIKKTADGREFQPNIAIFAKTDVVQRGDQVAIGTHADLAPIKESRQVIEIDTARPLVGTRDYDIYAD